MSFLVYTAIVAVVLYSLHIYGLYTYIIYWYIYIYIYISMYSTTLYVDNDNDSTTDNNNNRNNKNNKSNKNNNHVLLLLQGILNNILWYDMIEYNMTCYCMTWQMVIMIHTHTDIAFTLHYNTFLCGRGYQRQLKLMSDEGTQGEASIRGEVGPTISLNPIVPLGTSKVLMLQNVQCQELWFWPMIQWST